MTRSLLRSTAAIVALFAANGNAQVYDVTFDLAYTLPGGEVGTGLGSGSFDRDTLCGYGSVTTDRPDELGWPIIPLVAWLVLHFQSPAFGITLHELSGGELSVTSVMDLGPAGSAGASIHVLDDHATIDADFSQLDANQLADLGSQYDLTSLESIVGTGQGSALGTGGLWSDGFGLLATEINEYAFLGNPGGELNQELNIGYNAHVSIDSAHTASFSGKAIPQPASLWAIALAGLVGSRRRRRSRIGER